MLSASPRCKGHMTVACFTALCIKADSGVIQAQLKNHSRLCYAHLLKEYKSKEILLHFLQSAGLLRCRSLGKSTFYTPYTTPRLNFLSFYNSIEMVKLSAAALAVIALAAANTMALPRHYNARDVDIHAGPSTPQILSATVTQSAIASAKSGVHAGSWNGTHPHNGTVHGPHNGTHPHHHNNGTHPHQGSKNGTHTRPVGKQRIGTTRPNKKPVSSSPSSTAIPSSSGMMQIDGNTYTAGTKIGASNSTESEAATHNADNSTLDIKGSGNGTIKLGDNELPGGSNIHETNVSEGDGATSTESNSTFQVN
ncbi:hypothetical protein D9757_007419 [Collybiopsis confluens]|uniref:Uncharacterized protein n=1 Tax=Collybiopsis confluens TaxID=2823264 RepID=A0A8H5HIB0_9AGAR|nr:hypothetical protein D9757_007419 [Collybiopsis confluens]